MARLIVTMDAATNSYYRARYYDPATGRFLREYPAGIEFNLYVYTENNPTGFIDPNGLETLPKDPSGLGSDWENVTPHVKARPRFRRKPDGFEIEFDPKDPNADPTTWKGKDHWHEVCPETGKRKKKHLDPGTEIPDPPPPEPATSNAMSTAHCIAMDDAGRCSEYYIPSAYGPGTLVPVPINPVIPFRLPSGGLSGVEPSFSY